MSVNKLAVYGTLRRGYHNHDAHLWGSIMLGVDRIPGYILLHQGYFPAAVPISEPGFTIEVEIYQVGQAQLDRCDILEGVKTGFYSRTEIDTKYGRAYMYKQTSEPQLGEKWIPSGKWRARETGTAQWLGIEKETQLLKDDLFGYASTTKTKTTVPVGTPIVDLSNELRGKPTEKYMTKEDFDIFLKEANK